MRALVLVVVASASLTLAACDQDSKSNDVTVKGQNGTVTISANGQNFTMKASDNKSGNFTMSANGGHFTMRASDGSQNVTINATGSGGDTPDFVAVYPGGKVQSTTVNAGKDGTGGTISFQTTASPAAVIAWYKEKASSEGLAKGIDMNMGGTTMYTANADGGKKALQVIAASSSAGGAQVQVNWSGKK